MKKMIFVVVMLSVFINVRIAASSHQLENSAHNFVDGEGADSWYVLDNACEPCHAPSRFSDSPQTQQWEPERNVSFFPVYNAGTFDTEPGQPGKVSRMCMSCHDDSIADTMVLGETSQSHPVGIVYDLRTTFISQGELADPSRTGFPLFDGKIECPTCHDAHSNNEKMLRMDNNHSDMCLQCHYK